jgi:hypothetical protein
MPHYKPGATGINVDHVQDCSCNYDEQMLNADLDSLEDRLIKFYSINAPDLCDRIPMILDAYREWPLLLFPDIDAIYRTEHSTEVELAIWHKEPKERREIRVKVAQDYIYLHIHSDAHVHPSEKLLVSQAHMSAKFGSSGLQQRRVTTQRKPRIAGRIRQKVSDTRGRIRQNVSKAVTRRVARHGSNSWSSIGKNSHQPYSYDPSADFRTSIILMVDASRWGLRRTCGVHHLRFDIRWKQNQ